MSYCHAVIKNNRLISCHDITYGQWHMFMTYPPVLFTPYHIETKYYGIKISNWRDEKVVYYLDKTTAPHWLLRKINRFN